MSREINSYDNRRKQVSCTNAAQGVRKSSVPEHRLPAVRASEDNAYRSRNIKRNPNGRTPSRKPRIVTVKQQKKTPFPIGIVFSCLIITSLLLVIMVYFAELNSFSNDLTQLRSQVTDLNEEKEKLATKLDERDDIGMIQTRAKELGMIDSQLKNPIYVNMTNTDKTEIVEIDDEKSGFGFMLSGIGKLLKDFFGE
ncbi:MAG: hypothetical protein A2Y17_11895 [Clostridiales bacterium GWF2_38_85]|nr:MAG: hypothetical protein A2Y17_11895 [Clostridiales bacterium GWF2_38_85]HBL85404.1 hypothetical protein [Clostridiales bacterium]